MRIKITLMFADLLTVIVSFFLAKLLRFQSLSYDIQNELSTLIFLCVTIIILLYFFDLYNHYLYAQTGRVFFRIINVWLMSLILYVIIGFITKFYFLINSRAFIILFYITLFVFALIVRIVFIPQFFEHYFSKPERKIVCNYVGPKEIFNEIQSFFMNNSIVGLSIVPDEKKANPKPVGDATLFYSTTNEFGGLYQELKSLIIPERPLHVISNLFNELNLGWEWCRILNMPVYTFLMRRTSPIRDSIQRIIDIVVSAVFIIILAPFFLIIALAIKLDSPGPVIYKQRRCGKDGKEFTLYKFRSMLYNSENQNLREEEFRDYINRKINKGKLIDTKQVTRVGRILRRTSIDELPQFFNVLKGDMTLIGPRPPIPYEVKYYKEWHKDRLKVKPGISGLWQVYGRGNMPCDSSIFLDLIYIINRSLLLDIKLMFQTIPVVLLGKGAY